MALKYRKTSEIKRPYYKVVVWGNSGTGKTHSVALAQNAFMIAAEANGVDTARRANADLTLPEYEDVSANGDKVIRNFVRKMDEVREILKLAADGTLVKAGYTTLVVDGLTEVQAMIHDEMMGRESGGTDNSDLVVVSKSFSFTEWGIMNDKMRLFMRFLRDIPMHVIATALEQTTEITVAGAADGDDPTKKIIVRPLFQGRTTGAEVPKYFNAVGYQSKEAKTRAGEVKVKRVTSFSMPSEYISKECGLLAGRVVPDAAHWLDVLIKDTKPKRP